MTHGVIIEDAVAAQNVDAWNRSAVSASDVDNGNIVILTTKSTATNEGEVWTAVVPSTGNGLTGVWISGEPEIVKTGNYRGLDPDVRNYYNEIGKIFRVFKPQIGDIITLTADNLATGTGAASAYAVAVDTTGGLKPQWASSAGSSIFAMKYLKTTYISIGTGAINSQRVTAYQFEIVAL
jgi:hypothetical protein